MPDVFDLKPVAKETLRVEEIAMSVHEHYSVTFDIDHFSLANMAIITSLQVRNASQIHAVYKGGACSLVGYGPAPCPI